MRVLKLHARFPSVSISCAKDTEDQCACSPNTLFQKLDVYVFSFGVCVDVKFGRSVSLNAIARHLNPHMTRCQTILLQLPSV